MKTRKVKIRLFLGSIAVLAAAVSTTTVLISCNNTKNSDTNSVTNTSNKSKIKLSQSEIDKDRANNPQYVKYISQMWKDYKNNRTKTLGDTGGGFNWFF